MALAILTTSLCLTTSCKKDDEDATPNVVTTECLITKQTDSGGDINGIYIYDTQRRLIKFAEDESNASDYATLEYDNSNRVTKILGYEEGKLDATTLIEYNSQGKWSKITETYEGETEVDITTAEYDGNGNRIKINNANSTYTFEYSNGNLIKSVETEKNSGGTTVYTSTSTFEYYTDKENKLTAFEELYGLGYEGTPSKNMVKKRSRISGGSTIPNVYTYMYEYNEKGFPTKVTESNSDYDTNGDGKIDSLDTQSSSGLYTYQCK
jgi:hypothetical protein